MNQNIRIIRKRAGLPLGILCLVLATPGCNQQKATSETPNTRPGTAVESHAVQSSPEYFKTSFQNESEFIVQSVATDIAEMAIYAKDRTAPATGHVLVTAREDASAPASSPKYKLVVKLPNQDLKYDLQINPLSSTIWSPESYLGLTREIFKSLGLKGTAVPAEKSADVSLLNPLLNLTAQTIESENQRLSTALAQNFSSPVLHEKAALLVGAFTLRENSGYFFEIRSPLCRMTAHLTMARVLGNEAGHGLNGRVAEALLYTLMNNEKQALAKIDLIGHEEPAQAAWSRALKARNTLDFRPLAAMADRSLLETIEYFRAYRFAIDGTLAWNKLTKQQRASSSDFCRIVNERPVSVELGHVMLSASIRAEVNEASAVFQLTPDRQVLKAEDFIAALNELPDRCVGLDTNGRPAVHVIGRGQWGMFFQRHICHAIVSNYHFMQHMWGVPDQARDFAEKCDTMFSQLRLYPFVRKLNCRDEKTYRASIDDSFAVIKATPQIVSAATWNELYYQVPFAALYRPEAPGRVDEWHNHNPPPGTAYNPLPRFDHSNLIRSPDAVVRLQQLYELSPYDPDIEYALVHTRYSGHSTYAEAESIFRPILEYDTGKLSFLADKVKHDPAAYEAAMLKCAVLNPSFYYELADYLIGHGREEQAIPYLQKGMDLCPDSVKKANYAGRMIKYYVRQGQTDKAAALADFAAEVYSLRGLMAKAEFLESQGRYSEALDYYKKIEERYNKSEELINFCQRYKAKTGKSDFDETLARRSRYVFPRGMEKVNLTDFHAAPQDGVFVGAESRETAKAALCHGNVIVALDGIRVHTFDQYSYVRATENETEMHLIVWQNNQYREIMATPPEHKFGVTMTSYSPK